MATPQSTTSYQGDASASEGKTLEQITFRFCSECSNMLYPKEDEEAHKLQFTCRTCQYTEEARSTCVFRNILNNSAGETAGVTQDVGADPTVSSSQPHLQHASLFCTLCGSFITCDTCGEPSSDLTLTMTTATIKTTTRREDAEPSADYFAAYATNVGWTEEDLFEEFGDDAFFDFENASPTDCTETSSEFSSER
ncbi:DNA-directed RNA polymerase, M/15kDa subunit [Cordyceps fumosorosea ARSEF 2679]|uniref:DNA-directed RNA polymerase, M/15kDa subunit n=1 Tax=Cordyceps fumosorosea (strain ARSEF 2679) TaxID=1081104 RepID=A0A167LZU9_CORFA|nr:DNA-directed RNA polymerase, M/15kDa subunit [Cordyceps fumosorosea ARSEF 2679]OAA53736.1 DNA-directed RNA polymerase, M/15kDa subunit [Cordyceps fumosorosea ARSEF 2679]